MKQQGLGFRLFKSEGILNLRELINELFKFSQVREKKHTLQTKNIAVYTQSTHVYIYCINNQNNKNKSQYIK